ncbi:MAG: ATP-binding protein, partial [Anaerolineaceae bacterium]|nr:ATP-binding protein [Anaerolineaceae bacterium]
MGRERMPAKPGPDNYDVQLYLDRPKIFRQIIAWIAQRETRRRVLCLVAPPGSGKTWLLHHLQAELSKNPNPNFREPLLTFWLDAPDVVNVASKDRSDVIHKDKALQWIKQCYQKTHSFCRHVPSFDTYLSYPRSIEDLVEALCNQCDLPDGPVLFVDGYDEIPKLC